MENKKIYFLDLLRVFATISVFCSHVIFLFWTGNQTIQSLWQTPKVIYQSSWYSSFASTMRFGQLDYGSLGVALFFLISGFVFLPSEAKTQSCKDFIIKKSLRLYPVYWGGVCLMMSWAYIFRAEDNFLYSLKDIFITMTLFRPLWTAIPSVDGVSWYLECLVIFYTVGYIFNKFFSLKKFESVIFFTTIFFIFKLPWLYFNVLYILIGVCFSNLYYRHFTLKQFFCSVSLLCVIYYNIYKDFLPNTFEPIFLNYMYALGIFCIFYIWRQKPLIEKAANFKIFHLISKLSFPIYVVHGVCSYVIMANLYQIIPNNFVRVGASVLWTLAAATLLHYTIEEPMKKLSKKFERTASVSKA